MQESGEIGGAPLVTGDQTPGVLEPGEESFDFPAAFVPAERTTVLGEIDTVAAVRGDQLDAAGGERRGRAPSLS